MKPTLTIYPPPLTVAQRRVVDRLIRAVGRLTATQRDRLEQHLRRVGSPPRPAA